MTRVARRRFSTPFTAAVTHPRALVMLGQLMFLVGISIAILGCDHGAPPSRTHRIQKESAILVGKALTEFEFPVSFELPDSRAETRLELLSKSCSCFDVVAKRGEGANWKIVFKGRAPGARIRKQLAATFHVSEGPVDDVQIIANVFLSPRISIDSVPDIVLLNGSLDSDLFDIAVTSSGELAGTTPVPELEYLDLACQLVESRIEEKKIDGVRSITRHLKLRLSNPLLSSDADGIHSLKLLFSVGNESMHVPIYWRRKGEVALKPSSVVLLMSDPKRASAEVTAVFPDSCTIEVISDDPAVWVDFAREDDGREHKLIVHGTITESDAPIRASLEIRGTTGDVGMAPCTSLVQRLLSLIVRLFTRPCPCGRVAGGWSLFRRNPGRVLERLNGGCGLGDAPLLQILLA